MDHRSNTGRKDPKKSVSGPGVVDLADARVRLRPRVAALRAKFSAELDEIKVILDRGLASEVRSRLTSFMSAVRNDPSLLARARCVLASALEMEGRYQESLAAVSMYETPESQQDLDPDALAQIRVHISLAYRHVGDHPKAIALLKLALREATE